MFHRCLFFAADIVDFEAVQLRSDTLNGALVARAAVRLSEDILEQ